MLKTAICDLFGIEHPVIQGGMAHLGTAELVSAVSNAGGLGIIGAGYYDADWVREQIMITRALTDRPFGVNLPLTSPHAAAIIGVPHEEWGDEIRAVVVARAGGVTEEELEQHCQDRLSSYKRPRSVVFIDELPRNVMGKVLKRDLRAQYGQPD